MEKHRYGSGTVKSGNVSVGCTGQLAMVREKQSNLGFTLPLTWVSEPYQGKLNIFYPQGTNVHQFLFSRLHSIEL